MKTKTITYTSLPVKKKHSYQILGNQFIDLVGWFVYYFQPILNFKLAIFNINFKNKLLRQCKPIVNQFSLGDDQIIQWIKFYTEFRNCLEYFSKFKINIPLTTYLLISWASILFVSIFLHYECLSWKVVVATDF